jgi:NAD(P)-dependent dehydrogenase (short-subunit alcohol dehydrogenase family)
MSLDLRLDGRSAVATAAGKGIGRAVVQALSDAGMRIVACARSNPAEVPASVYIVSADLCAAGGCKILARPAIEHLGNGDVLVNVLGGSSAPPGGFAALDDEAWLRRNGADVNSQSWSAAQPLVRERNRTEPNGATESRTPAFAGHVRAADDEELRLAAACVSRCRAEWRFRQ